MSLGFGEEYLAVIDAVKTKIEELKTAGDLENVYFGPRSKMGPYPVAFIVPARYDVEFEGRMEYHPIAISMVVVSRNSDVEAGLRANILLAAKCRDKLYEDRSQGGLVNRTKVGSFGPEIEQDENYYLFRSEMKVALTRLWFV